MAIRARSSQPFGEARFVRAGGGRRCLDVFAAAKAVLNALRRNDLNRFEYTGYFAGKPCVDFASAHGHFAIGRLTLQRVL
jgi:hypothetical protein